LLVYFQHEFCRDKVFGNLMRGTISDVRNEKKKITIFS